MRKIIVIEFITLDGVIQSPGRRDEDERGDFPYGGWIGGYSDPALSARIREEMGMPFELLLGRKTFDIWSAYWPDHREIWPEVSTSMKYVVSDTVKSHDWGNTEFIGGDKAERIGQLKGTDGPDLHVYGSSQLVQLLLEEDLIDEFWLKIYPVILGKGLRLFRGTPLSSYYEISESLITRDGVILVNYRRKPGPAAGYRTP